ncbi:MAG TPA: hypothetical protein VGO95_11545 [Modestobacter sp.]|nr:hypothetical protein [Modestobacter sp.]
MSTPGAGGPQPPEQDPSQSGQPADWGQQPPAGQPQPGQESQQPWGAQQPPAGQPQPGQEPPQQPWGAAQPPAGAPGFGQPQPEKPKRKWLPIVGGIVALIVVLVALSSFLGGGDPEVGDCIHQTGASAFDTVDCDADNADFRIVGTDADMTGEEFDATSAQELCTDFANATSVLWYGSDNAKDGHVYCAEDV